MRHFVNVFIVIFFKYRLLLRKISGLLMRELMNIFKFLAILAIILLIISILLWHRPNFCPAPGAFNNNYIISDQKEITKLFPTSVAQLNTMVEQAKKCALEHINAILQIPSNERTFDNTIRALDIVTGFNFMVPHSTVVTIAMVSKDKDLREAAQKAEVDLGAFSIDNFGQNKQLYLALKEYADGNGKQEKLTTEQRYFLNELMDDYKRAGLELPDETRVKVKKILQELTELTTQFSNNISNGRKTLTVSKEELLGMDEDFINALEKTNDGLYIISTDYPTYLPIMEHCNVEKTRKNSWLAFNNRAYPENIQLLKKISALRHEFAVLLGYQSYTDVTLADQMAKSPANVRKFITSIIDRAKIKEKKEFDELKTDLPESVTLVNEKLKPWDFSFAKASFKKKHYQYDDREIAEYFPMEHTVEGLLRIYEQFFSIKLKKSSTNDLWQSDLTMIEVYDAHNDELIGYLVLDLYPRENKYSHACQITIVPAVTQATQKIPGVAVVLANLTKSTATKPSLLKPNEMRTFFHEFGHALHALFGTTDLASHSGTNVKRDFVEMPSQMLEEWLYDKQTLISLSKHYLTGQPIPDNLLNNIFALKNFSTGYWSLLQAVYSLLSLNYFDTPKNNNVSDMFAQLNREFLPNILFDEENHMPANFDHLMSYGARYYGYLWSKVFALDLFKTIQKVGLLNPVIGTKYAQKVLTPGGSKDPNEMLKDFLGRAPNSDAFFADLGL